MDRKPLTSGMHAIDHLVHAALPGIVLVTAVQLAGCANDPSDSGDDIAVAHQPAIVATGTDVGTLPGAFAVSPSGSASYSIPLWTPQGRGLTPELALSYSSAGGDSSAGLGWGLSGGFSMIHRCPTSSQRVERPRPVRFTSADTFCLDGRPLVLVAGTHGFTGAEYRTEPETFAKVVIDAHDDLGPISFTVFTRDGLIHSYASALDPMLVVEAVTSIWSFAGLTREDTEVFTTSLRERYGWLRHTIRDRFPRPNTIVFGYIHPTRAGQENGEQPLLDRIEYVDVDGFQTRSIKLSYIDRPTSSRRTELIAGMTFSHTKLLKSIDMRVAKPGAQSLESVRFYNLTHESSRTTDRPLLTRIQECDGNPSTGRNVSCKQPTSFTYEGGNDGFQIVATSIQDVRQPQDADFWGLQVADLNHDGRDDLVYRKRGPQDTAADPPRWFARLSLGESFADPIELPLRFSSNFHLGSAIIADFANADGLPDIAVPIGDNTFAFYQNLTTPGDSAEGVVRFELLTMEQAAPNRAMAIGDFNGKGRVSILRPTADGRWGFQFVSNGLDGPAPIMTEMSAPLPVIWRGDFARAGWSAYQADIDFDGADDFLTLVEGGPANRLFVLTQRRPSNQAVSPPAIDDWQISTSTTLLASAPGDVVWHAFFDHNGDGLPDALRLRQGRKVPDLIVNSGRGFARPRPVTALAGTAANVKLGAGTTPSDLQDPGIRILDFDHDGRQDLLLVDNGVVRDSSANPTATARDNLTILLSRGDGFVARTLPIKAGLPADGFHKPASAMVHNYQQTQVLDVNGDGLTDIVQMSAATNTLEVLVRQGKKPDLLIAVKDGMGKKTDVTYAPMSDRRVHTPLQLGRCAFPHVCQTRGDWLVASYRMDNGDADKQNEFRCTYQDKRIDREGGGVLGFSEWSVTDVAASTTVRYVYDLSAKAKVQGGRAQDGEPTMVDVYTHIGLPVLQEAQTIGRLFTRTVSTRTSYEFVKTNNGASYYTRPLQISTTDDETSNGTTTRLSTREQVMIYVPELDDYGILSGVTDTTDTGSKSADESYFSEFDNFPDDWLLGLERHRRTSSRSFEGAGKTRTTELAFDRHTGALNNMTIEPDAFSDEFLFVELTRNDFGQVEHIAHRDPFGNERSETIGYDEQSVFPRTSTNKLGHVTVTEIDPALGVVRSITDANNAKTTFDHDGFGRLRQINHPGGGSMSVTYARDLEIGSVPEAERFVTKVTTSIEGGGEIRTLTNRLGQEIRRETKNLDGTFSFVEHAYSPLGTLKSATRPALVGNSRGAATTWIFDELARMTERTRPEDGFDARDNRAAAATATRTYVGLVTTSTDDLGRVSRVTYDAVGRVIKREEKNEKNQFVSTDLRYGAFDELEQVVRTDGAQAARRTTSLTYDVLGRRRVLDDPMTGKRETRYNGFGEVRQEEDANGKVTVYVLDGLGRVKEKRDKDGTTTFTWDTAPNGKGRLAEAVSPSGVKREFSYDVFGRTQAETWTIDGQRFRLDYSYDSVGRLDKISYPDVAGRGFSRLVAKYLYDRDSGQLSGVQNDSTQAMYWELKSTRPDGQIAQEAFANKLQTDYSYSDVTGRIAGMVTKLPDTQTAKRSFSYSYWQDGSLRHRSDVRAGQPERHERFVYDPLGRLKIWQLADRSGKPVNGWAVNYAIDDFGNQLRRTVLGNVSGAVIQTVTYDLEPGTDRVISSPFGTYQYDANGNQTARGAGEAITYTAFDLPSQITGPRAATFLYDAFGTRVTKRKSNGDRTVYVGGLYEQRVVAAATEHIFYIQAGGRTVAQVTRSQASGGKETTVFLHDDPLGSVDTVTDDKGNIIEQTMRDPYGNKISEFNNPILPTSVTASANKVRLGFTGHEDDDDLALINMRGRIYDPRLARFLTPDPFVSAPLVGQTYNRYSYVRNNPLNFVDPTGLSEDLPDTPAPQGQNDRVYGIWGVDGRWVPGLLGGPNSGTPGGNGGGGGAPVTGGFGSSFPPSTEGTTSDPGGGGGGGGSAPPPATTPEGQTAPPPANQPVATKPAQNCSPGCGRADFFGFSVRADAWWYRLLAGIGGYDLGSLPEKGDVWGKIGYALSPVLDDIRDSAGSGPGGGWPGWRRFASGWGRPSGPEVPRSGGPPPASSPLDFDAARRKAFEKAGMTDPEQVTFSEVDPKTGTVVEFKGPGGAEIGYDGPHVTPGKHHDTQHISWHSAGKRGEGRAGGNIPYCGTQHPSRPEKKE